jgi:hypothetical protein
MLGSKSVGCVRSYIVFGSAILIVIPVTVSRNKAVNMAMILIRASICDSNLFNY